MSAVELPNMEREDYSYFVVNYFEERKDAIKWAMDNLGADENGMICVVSTWQVEEDEE